MTENTNTNTTAPAIDADTLKAAQKAVPNGGRIFVTDQGVTDTGIASFHVYAAKITRAGNVLMTDVTDTLKALPGADGKFRGRPRNESVLRAMGDDKTRPAKVLSEQVAQALYGAEGRLTVQEL